MRKIFIQSNLPVVILNISTILIVAVMLMVNQALAKPDQTTTSETFYSGVLSYQGTLMDSLGNPVTGSYEITFRVYNSPTSTTPLWEEVRSGANAVPVQNGLFNVMLGSLIPIPETVWEQTELFLGVKIGSDAEMSPREKLTAVPAAASANVAQLALTVPDGSISAEKLGADVNNYLIQSGKKNCDWVICSGWSLHTGDGVRTYTTRVTFTSNYSSPPAINVSINGFDMFYETNPRIDVYAQNITNDGFDLVYYTWGETIVYGAYTSWIAYGTK